MADKYDIEIDQGSSWSLPLTWDDGAEPPVPINLTGYTARMKIKDRLDGTLLVSLTEADGIALGGVAGTITLSRTEAQTKAFTWTEGVYDLELVSGGGTVTRLMQGKVTVDREVTT